MSADRVGAEQTDAATTGPAPQTTAQGPAAPLSGVRVLELGSLIAGPFAGRLLADFGEEVIKIEDPRRLDPLRDWGQARRDGETLWWPVQSRNKRLVTLDLHAQAGRGILLDLVERSDVLVENFRPGTLERWSLGPEQLWSRNPALIVARVSGFGQTGPRSHRPGYASVAEAMGGMRHLNGFPGQPPPRTGLSLGDSLAAMFAFQGILMALYWRDARGGRIGQVVDVSLVESCFAMLESVVPEYAATGAVRQPSGTGLTGLAPSNLFRSADGKWVIIAANQDTVFARLCAAMGASHLVTDPRFATHTARGEHQEEIEGLVAEWAQQYTSKDLAERLEEAGVPSGVVYTVADIFADPQFTAREMLLETTDDAGRPLVMPGIVPKLSRTPGAVAWSGSRQAGRDNRRLYRELLNMEDDDLARLEDQGVTRPAATPTRTSEAPLAYPHLRTR